MDAQIAMHWKHEFRRRLKLTVIGAGPIGIELAVALKRAGVEYVHFERSRSPTRSRGSAADAVLQLQRAIAIAGVPLVTTDQSKAFARRD